MYITNPKLQAFQRALGVHAQAIQQPPTLKACLLPSIALHPNDCAQQGILHSSDKAQTKIKIIKRQGRKEFQKCMHRIHAYAHELCGRERKLGTVRACVQMRVRSCICAAMSCLHFF